MKNEETERFYVLLFVDDGLMMSESDNAMNDVLDALECEYNMTVYKLTQRVLLACKYTAIGIRLSWGFTKWSK